MKRNLSIFFDPIDEISKNSDGVTVGEESEKKRKNIDWPRNMILIRKLLLENSN